MARSSVHNVTSAWWAKTIQRFQFSENLTYANKLWNRTYADLLVKHWNIRTNKYGKFSSVSKYKTKIRTTIRLLINNFYKMLFSMFNLHLPWLFCLTVFFFMNNWTPTFFPFFPAERLRNNDFNFVRAYTARSNTYSCAFMQFSTNDSVNILLKHWMQYQLFLVTWASLLTTPFGANRKCDHKKPTNSFLIRMHNSSILTSARFILWLVQ